MNIGKGMLGILVKAALLGGLAVGGTASAAGFTVPNNVPPAVAKAKAKFVKHHSPDAILDIRLVLPVQNGVALSQLLHDQRDRSSPNYRHFLTPSQFKVQFGYADDDAKLASVVDFLESHGLKVTGFSFDNTRIHATAKTSVVEHAFSVAINDYSFQGKTFYAPSSDPRMPASVNVPVMAVLGLDDAVTLRPHNIPGKTAPTGRALVGPQGFMPQQIASIYNMPDVTNAANGAGVTIAIATAFNFRMLDLKHFWATAGVPAHTGASAVSVVAVDGRPTRVLNGETTLDVERSGSVAPGAAIKVYECVNPFFVSFDDEFSEIAGDSTVQVVSTSWGSPESDLAFASIGSEHQSFVTMAAEGMTVFAAAGDNGASDGTNDPDHADYPAVDPYVVSAGGTSLVASGSSRISETAWSGAGGADSTIFAAPTYQTTPITGLTANTSCAKDYTGDSTDFGATTGDLCSGTGNASRQNSDMALDADPGTGYAIYYNSRWEVFGGTSFVAPELAGYFADILQQSGFVSGPGMGRGNDIIYCVGTGSNGSTPAADFFDVTTGSNGPHGIFDAGTGWDHPTGFGSLLDGAAFASDVIANCP